MSKHKPSTAHPGTRLTLRPGQNYTKKRLHKYGERLVAVRDHYDPSRRRRLKTVELIEQELPWDPPPHPDLSPDTPVPVRVGWQETDLREQVKSAGARWDKQRKVWMMPLATARVPGLEPRIVKDPSTGIYL